MYKIVNDIPEGVQHDLVMCSLKSDLIGFSLDNRGNLSCVEELSELKKVTLRYIWDIPNRLFYRNDGRLTAHKRGCIREICTLYPCPLTECNGIYSIVKQGGDR